ncbi:hypothetical protein [Streptomyces hesseae]|uniref:Uncharacterized protein n=1 Tax=Streptomyces hesseae TaxID=3075519 RepID=A0ABU2SYH8_9ACTN|nr:hypothetical protein [Streptomyces sp. DSM 40473]MDT0453409.1 hypothetical protein [Streptomyces sp. DSM 40473]
MSVRVESNSYLTDEQHRVYTLREALERNGGTPSGFLELLAVVIDDETWRKVPTGVNSDEPFEDFASFVEAKPPFGLGAKVADVRVLLQIKHPHEGVRRVREQMDRMRAEVNRLLGISPSEDPVTRDARDFGGYAKAGGWLFGLKVARCVQPGSSQREKPESSPHGSRNEATKVSANEFGRRAGCSANRVMRFYRAWSRAVEDGLVPSFEDLQPGVDIDLPDADAWSQYYTTRSSGGSERGARITAAAEAEGIRPTKALEVAENPTALRVAILSDSGTAEAARNALMDRLEDDLDLQVAMAKHISDTTTLRKAVAAETKRAGQVEYVRTALEEGVIKSPAGQVIQLPDDVKAEAEKQLTHSDQAARSGPAEAAAAYEVLHQFVAQSVAKNPQVNVQERRAALHGRVRQASKAFEQLSLDEVGELYDEELIESLEQLSGLLAECLQSMRAAAQRPPLRALKGA